MVGIVEMTKRLKERRRRRERKWEDKERAVIGEGEVGRGRRPKRKLLRQRLVAARRLTRDNRDDLTRMLSRRSAVATVAFGRRTLATQPQLPKDFFKDEPAKPKVVSESVPGERSAIAPRGHRLTLEQGQNPRQRARGLLSSRTTGHTSSSQVSSPPYRPPSVSFPLTPGPQTTPSQRVPATIFSSNPGVC